MRHYCRDDPHSIGSRNGEHGARDLCCWATTVGNPVSVRLDRVSDRYRQRTFVSVAKRVAPGGGAPSSAATGLVELYGRREMLGGA